MYLLNVPCRGCKGLPENKLSKFTQIRFFFLPLLPVPQDEVKSKKVSHCGGREHLHKASASPS
ncbi:MAG: hypothetical protein RM347_029125, partial [Nostoc sp. ChiQUE02]|uniref:hypothetical protein n=1 Tax=Nostoc sp. ChiQUE02 TaxID=3075377 RepID=UPI003D161605